MFRNILYPFDGTARCMLAAPEIVQLVKVNRAQLRVLYVNRGSGFDMLALQDLQTEIGRLMGADASVPAPLFDITEGKADEEILRFASDHNIDLIAMPLRGLTWFRRRFTRSTTESVLRGATCPVWVITKAERPVPKTGRIVCGISQTRDAASLVREAGVMVKLLGGELTLAYPVPELNEGTLARMSQDPPFLSAAAARRYLHTVAQSAGVYAECAAEVGAEEKVFARVSQRISADLLIIDRSKRGVPIDIARLARRTGCPVLVTDAGFIRERLRNTMLESEASVASSVLAINRRRIAAR